jgi:hypothetical protein
MRNVVSITLLGLITPLAAEAAFSDLCQMLVRFSPVFWGTGIVLIAVALVTLGRIAYLLLLFYDDSETHIAIKKYATHAILEIIGAVILFTIIRSCS